MRTVICAQFYAGHGTIIGRFHDSVSNPFRILPPERVDLDDFPDYSDAGENELSPRATGFRTPERIAGSLGESSFR
jgi:hypothetical protein